MIIKDIYVHIVLDTKEDFKFTVSINNEYEYFVEAYLIEDTDTFRIRAYDNIYADVNPHNCNEVLHGLYDSDGGTFEGFEVEVNLEKDNNNEIINKLENLIIDVLFDDDIGLTKHYNYSIEED